MSIEAQAKEMAERIGWPYAHAAHIRCAGIDDMARAMIAFSDERNKELKSAVSDLLKSLSDDDDEGMMEHAEPVRRVRAMLNPKE